MVSGYGMRAGVDGVRRQHNGLDILASPTDDGVYAFAPGTVEHATSNGAYGFGGYGHVVVLRHEPRDVGGAWPVRTMYAHLAAIRPEVSEGAHVAAGQRIGTVGATNGATTHPGTTFADGRHDPSGRLDTSRRRPSAAHLHFEVAQRAYPMRSTDPRLDAGAFLRARGLSWDERGGPRALGVTHEERPILDESESVAPARAQGCAPAVGAIVLVVLEVLRWL